MCLYRDCIKRRPFKSSVYLIDLSDIYDRLNTQCISTNNCWLYYTTCILIYKDLCLNHCNIVSNNIINIFINILYLLYGKVSYSIILLALLHKMRAHMIRIMILYNLCIVQIVLNKHCLINNV